jgi:hypothetical protein
MVGTLKTPGAPTRKVGLKRLGLFVLSVAALIGAASSRAAPQFDVFLGYDGIVPEASWFPVVFEIKNDGPSFTGIVELSPASYGKGQTHRVVVELPTGTLKRLVVPAFSPSRYPSTWDARLLDERGRVQAEQTMLRPRRQTGWEVPLIGSLARTAAGTPELPPPLRNQLEMQPATARLQPAIFPDNPLVLEGLQALYLSSEVAAGLKAGQVSALIGWMNAGGHLIVGVEQVSDVTALPWLRNLMPCELQGMRPLHGHPQIQEWLRAASVRTNVPAPVNVRNIPGRRPTPQPSVPASTPFADSPDDPVFEAAELSVAIGALRDGRAVVTAGDTPLIVTANRGQGKVTALMFSPEREPFKSWKNLPLFWARLTEVSGDWYASTDYYQGYGPSTDGIFGAMIDSRQVHKLPIGWLLLLLLVYLLVIGPFDQYWLKRIGRPMLTWITFPCYVVLFSLLIYFIGYKLRAGESEWNELHVVDVLLNSDHAELRGRTYISVYSPVNQKYMLESGQKTATLRGEFSGATGGQVNERATVLQNGDSFKAEIFVPVWTSQLFISDWWQSAPLPLSVSIVPQGESWEVTVQNLTDRAMTAAQLVINGRIIPLGGLAAGQIKTFSVTKNQGTALRDFVQQHGGVFQGAVQQRQRAFGESAGGQIGDLPNASMAASFVRQLARGENRYNNNFVAPPGLDLTRVVERGNAVLLAWADDYSPVKPMNPFRSRRNASHTLWRVTVQCPGP